MSILKQVTLPAAITEIEDYVFYGCADLEEISLPDGITTIGDYAFADCEKLNGLSLPENLVSIGNNAFQYCSGLEKVYSYNPTPPSCGSKVFDGITQKVLVR